jgi:hypothetical protein
LPENNNLAVFKNYLIKKQHFDFWFCLKLNQAFLKTELLYVSAGTSAD